MAKLTIGQLAAHVGVTVRAIRHYHRMGLLEEPERDVSGYRRYDAQAVVDLIKIKTLSDAGVPLSRVEQLLGADEAEFAAAITEIDVALKQRIRELNRHRRRIAELAEGDRLFLPAEVAAILDQLREMGVSERTVQTERDGWIVVAALSPEQIPPWAEEKLVALADPEFRRLYLAIDQALDWDLDDPRLAGLVSDLLSFRDKAYQGQQREPADVPLDPAVVKLMTEHIAEASPMWQRLDELAAQRLRRERDG
jgi:DNA-binding transcriptional MerR regulator